ncbi:MAG: DUF1540 domain-containing protein [Oscillospiraceae bacterium]|nr:DUF1540 domain-containing protein [Oscillospiraceae bacterium]
MIKAKKCTENLPGVNCDVTNCVYNSPDHMCHADHIQVANQTQSCKNEQDTFCGTFEAR